MNERTERRRGTPRWVFIVVGLLVLHVSGMVVAMTIATRDPSSTSTPDYYDRAVRWDEHVAELRASERLGWDVTVAASALRDRAVVTVRDEHGAPVAGGRGSLRAYHVQRTEDVASYPLTERGDGWYDAPLDMARPGLWIVDVELDRREGERFVEQFEVVVPALELVEESR